MGVASLAGAYYPTVGASGAVFGLLLAYAMMFPRRTIVPPFSPIPMRAPAFVAVDGVLELVLGVTGTQTGIAHFVHLGGLAGGLLFMRFRKAWRRHVLDGRRWMNLFGGAWHLVMLVAAFLGIVWWAFGAKRKKRFEQDGDIPFKETD
jgi:membrane associated rhomboid family serine protease